MYMVFAIYAGVIGGVLAILIRAELQYPGLQIVANPHTYNMFVTNHGLIMIFFALMPAMMGGFGNWMVPLMIGAPNMAFLSIMAGKSKSMVASNRTQKLHSIDNYIRLSDVFGNGIRKTRANESGVLTEKTP